MGSCGILADFTILAGLSPPDLTTNHPTWGVTIAFQFPVENKRKKIVLDQFNMPRTEKKNQETLSRQSQTDNSRKTCLSVFLTSSIHPAGISRFKI